MKNNTKKASIKFWEVIFSAFYADFCLCPKSVIIPTVSHLVPTNSTIVIYIFAENIVRNCCTAKAPYIFSAKNDSLFMCNMFEILTLG